MGNQTNPTQELLDTIISRVISTGESYRIRRPLEYSFAGFRNKVYGLCAEHPNRSKIKICCLERSDYLLIRPKKLFPVQLTPDIEISKTYQYFTDQLIPSEDVFLSSLVGLTPEQVLLTLASPNIPPDIRKYFILFIYLFHKKPWKATEIELIAKISKSSNIELFKTDESELK